MHVANLHIIVGWSAMFLGVVTGAAIGLYFHNDEWMGGYGTFRRRMLRLAHIAFFGLGFINLMFAMTVQTLVLPAPNITIASYGFIIGAITMPLICLLTAMSKPFRHLFPLPVISVLAGIVSILHGWARM